MQCYAYKAAAVGTCFAVIHVPGLAKLENQSKLIPVPNKTDNFKLAKPLMLTGNIYSLKPRKSFRPGRSSLARASFALAALCALGAILVMVTSLASVFQFPKRLPPNTNVSGVPVGGLTLAAAQERLTTLFFSPLTLTYEQQQISLSPELVDFKLDFDETIAQIPPAAPHNFWGLLVGRLPTAPPTTARLIASVNGEKLTAFLNSVASRYDSDPGVAAADATAMVTVINAPGRTLDVQAAARAITTALLSPTNRSVQLQSQSGTSLHPRLVVLFDPEAVQACVKAGVRSEVRLMVGGKTDDRHGKPVEIAGRVRMVADGKYVEPEPRHGGKRFWDMGVTAVVETEEGHQIVLNSLREAPMSLHQVLCLGIRPETRKVMVVKGATAPRAAYEPVSAKVIPVDTPGVTAAGPDQFTYHHRPRPLYPLDK